MFVPAERTGELLAALPSEISATGVLVHYLGPDDPRVARLLTLT